MSIVDENMLNSVMRKTDKILKGQSPSSKQYIQRSARALTELGTLNPGVIASIVKYLKESPEGKLIMLFCGITEEELGKRAIAYLRADVQESIEDVLAKMSEEMENQEAQRRQAYLDKVEQMRSRSMSAVVSLGSVGVDDDE